MKIINIIFTIWAYLPMFSLTDDIGFLTACSDNVNHEYYFSLINILFGEKLIQFISFPIKQPNKKTVLFRVKSLSKMSVFDISDTKENELKTNYKKHLDSLSDDDNIIEREALLQHLSAQQSRIDISYNKINAFTAIIIAIIPLMIAFIDIETIASINRLGLIVFLLLIYANVNLCAWIFQSINVRSYKSSSFKDLKESADKAKERNWQIYYDWQQTKRKADLFVSYVMCIKQWTIIVLLLTLVFSLSLPFKKKTVSHSDNTYVYTIQVEYINKTYDKSAVDWYSMLAHLQTGEYTKVLVLYNDTDISIITNKLEQFKQQELVLLVDVTLKTNEIKIILEK